MRLACLGQVKSIHNLSSLLLGFQQYIRNSLLLKKFNPTITTYLVPYVTEEFKILQLGESGH